MSYSLKITSGDLVADGSRFEVVTGIDKIQQELSIWLAEKFRCDRFHPNYGSVLDNFIGDSIDRSTGVKIRSEVMRVINNYIMVKMKEYRNDPEKFTDDEMLDKILSVDVKQDYDTIHIVINYVTIAQTTARLIQTVNV